MDLVILGRSRFDGKTSRESSQTERVQPLVCTDGDPMKAAEVGTERAAQSVATIVAEGLAAKKKRLPAWLFYDAEGSALFEQITELDEYYPTRTEKKIFEQNAEAMADTMVGGDPVTVVELGAGTAQKTVLLLRALSRRVATTFVPVDVSPSALAVAKARVLHELPGVRVRELEATHEQAFRELRRLPGRKVVLFIGSSIGNYEDEEAVHLLSGVQRALGRDGVFILGTDLKKSPARLVPAYDDARGVTARFNLNMLARINRELGGRFELERFRHVALWNEAESRIEMHLESRMAQHVWVESLGTSFRFEEGERIHTESSIKYDTAHVDSLLGASGLSRLRTFEDAERLFAVHLIRSIRLSEAL